MFFKDKFTFLWFFFLLTNSRPGIQRQTTYLWIIFHTQKYLKKCLISQTLPSVVRVLKFHSPVTENNHFHGNFMTGERQRSEMACPSKRSSQVWGILAIRTSQMKDLGALIWGLARILSPLSTGEFRRSQLTVGCFSETFSELKIQLYISLSTLVYRSLPKHRALQFLRLQAVVPSSLCPQVSYQLLSGGFPTHDYCPDWCGFADLCLSRHPSHDQACCVSVSICHMSNRK